MPTSVQKTKNYFSLLAAILVLASAASVFAVWLSKQKTNKTTKVEAEDQKNEYAAQVQNGYPVAIPQKILDNQFGFLSGGEEDNPFVGDAGAAWVRPHPGPFLWDAMQKAEDGTMDFSETDAIVAAQQKQNYGILATLWPFAEWDQANRADADSCKVSEADEFLPDSKESKGKGRPDYLPLHRCNPDNWDAYAAWISAVVERYDGDGTDDMLGLNIPIKYWEVMNEPDLQSPEPISTLDFYQSSATDYADLLIRSSQAIKTADLEAQVLIAGAAGGNDQFLGFYRTVFAQPNVVGSFDIANVHCISNDNYDSFNIEPYQKLLDEFEIDKPIWVTEAEAIVSSNPDINATQTLLSTDKALELGADRIFYTRYEFTARMDLKDRPAHEINIPVEVRGDDAIKAYQQITYSN